MKKKNNAGFSLVELIIVIAIMMILIGFLTPQFLKYVEKSRRAADMELMDNLFDAFSYASMDASVDESTIVKTNTNLGALSATSGIPADNDYVVVAMNCLGITSFADYTKHFKSRAAKGVTPADVQLKANGLGVYTIVISSRTIGEDDLEVGMDTSR